MSDYVKKISKDAKQPPLKRKVIMRPDKKFTAAQALEGMLIIIRKELSRLEIKQLDASGLSTVDIKNMALLNDQLAKLREEIRREKKQSILEGKTDEEIAELVKQALEKTINE